VKRVLVAIAVLTLLAPLSAGAQQPHDHSLTVNAVGGGIPYFCASPTATAVADGLWSDPATWSPRAVPAANAKVSIPAERAVSYDVVADAAIQCIELAGRLSFSPDVNTRMKIVSLVVMSGGTLEVGTPARPVQAGRHAEIVIADQPFDSRIDPGQIGNGIVGLGRIVMHGSAKRPTFARSTSPVRAGDTTVSLERPADGWTVGDWIVVPDTRQLRDGQRGRAFSPQDETRAIVAVSGDQITVAPAFSHDHLGAGEVAGVGGLLPHVGNLTRNVIVRSERANGTRGHMIFLARADVDLRYVEVRDMGRTRMGLLDNTSFAGDGTPMRVGTNQIGRYAIHFHHNFGPENAPSNGYQYTLIGNAVRGAAKWGITIHNTHFGLVQDNVVYDTKGAAIVTEDGSESFNVFDHNFAVRAEGAGDNAPRSGYGGGAPDLGGDGSGFWFSGPNNYVRNNVAASADMSGFSLAGGAGLVRIPAAKGGDTTRLPDTRPLDTRSAAALEFSNNEAYGVMQVGLECSWSAVISRFVVWNASRYGMIGNPFETLEIERLVARGQPAQLADTAENPTAIWLSNYAGKQIVVRGADIEGWRTGVASPFVSGHTGQPVAGRGSVLIEGSRFRNYFGVVVDTGYADPATSEPPAKHAVVRASTFETLPGVPLDAANPPAAISMNYRMAPGDTAPRAPIFVYDFNNQPGDSFKVYYSLDAPPQVAPCHESRGGIGGWVCQ
jgi:hypothetical protein